MKPEVVLTKLQEYDIVGGKVMQFGGLRPTLPRKLLHSSSILIVQAAGSSEKGCNIN
jgi:hypothetical protein